MTPTMATTLTKCVVWPGLLSVIVAAAGSVAGDTANTRRLPADGYTVHDVQGDGVTLRFLAKPPHFDIQRVGTTAWYPCVPEAVLLQPQRGTDTATVTTTTTIAGDLDNDDSLLDAITVQWLTPGHLPRINYTGGEWDRLRGHGYFVAAADANNSLVLVNPTVSDAGRYICRLQLPGGPSIEAHMELHITRFARLSFRQRALYGVVGAVVVGFVVGLLYALHRFVVRPALSARKSAQRREPGAEVLDPDEARPSLQVT